MQSREHIVNRVNRARRSAWRPGSRPLPWRPARSHRRPTAPDRLPRPPSFRTARSRPRGPAARAASTAAWTCGPGEPSTNGSTVNSMRNAIAVHPNAVLLRGGTVSTSTASGAPTCASGGDGRIADRCRRSSRPSGRDVVVDLRGDARPRRRRRAHTSPPAGGRRARERRLPHRNGGGRDRRHDDDRRLRDRVPRRGPDGRAGDVAPVGRARVRRLRAAHDVHRARARSGRSPRASKRASRRSSSTWRIPSCCRSTTT